jgi:hypothetical protein
MHLGSKADTLQRAGVNVWKNSECQESFKASNKPNIIAKTQLCAGKVTGGVDSCWVLRFFFVVSHQKVKYLLCFLNF